MSEETSLFDIGPGDYLPTQADARALDWVTRAHQTLASVFGQNKIAAVAKTHRLSGVQRVQCLVTGIDATNRDKRTHVRITLACDGTVDLSDVTEARVPDLVDALWLVAYLGEALKIDITCPNLEVPF
ncbi:hypothetical protein [Paraburkholderia sp. SIMBA_054]|uniref:hypothetical protein n=1 Tax=Paraburkholderia sp. SIMBA_054 TaxID=3085795 RepID=UPI00397C678B